MGYSPLYAGRGMPYNTPANVQFCSFRELAPGGTLLWASELFITTVFFLKLSVRL